MRNRKLFEILALTSIVFLMLSGGIMASHGEGGGGDGGGGSNTEPDYGDIYVLYRDSDGIPILSKEGCRQPLAATFFDGCITTLDGNCLVPVDQETCVPEPAYDEYLQEVEFGRTNLARSPDSVLQTQLDEVVFNLTTAGCLSLDPAGRMVYSSEINGVVESYTIDSPLQNLAIYRQLMRTGQLHENIKLPDWKRTAAIALGAAMDKEGSVTVDLTAYLNMILGLTEESVNLPEGLERKCLDIKQEIKGKVGYVEECFILYNSFSYYRYGNFTSLPDPDYIQCDNPNESNCLEYMEVVSFDPLQMVVVKKPILESVSELKENKNWEGSKIGGFAKAADDARAVVEFMHNYEVPDFAKTQVTCSASPDTYFDVSISERSGLQVPVRMVADTEGREGVVTVYNEGPAAASGTVMVTGLDEAGNDIVELFWVEGEEVTDIPIFATPEPFTLSAGASRSWTFFFSMDDSQTIYWKAHADADGDINENNNTVYQETVVRQTNRGGGH